MKKFCSKCGSQLDLGKKLCVTCNAFNPYFIAGFESEITLLHPATNDHVIEEPDWQKENTADIEKLRLEQLEQQKNEQELKNELLKVKEETQQFRKETFNLVKDVQKELHDIEKENQLLKEKVELLKTASSKQDANIPPTLVNEPIVKNQKRFTVIAALMFLMVVTGISYYFFSSSNPNPVVNSKTTIPVPAQLPAPVIESKQVAQKNDKIDSVPVKKLLAVASTRAISKPVAETFSLTASKLKADLVGKTLSGCDITIKNSAEVIAVGNLVLIDKLSASYLKYKCTIQIVQTGNVYTSTSYIYYSADGSFIKVDGTNCE